MTRSMKQTLCALALGLTLLSALAQGAQAAAAPEPLATQPLLIARQPSALSLAQAAALAHALRALVWLALGGRGLLFVGPGGFCFLVNPCNTGGTVHSPCF